MEQLPVDSAETRTLLEQARAGDRHAFDQLFAREQEGLHQFIDLHLDLRVRARVDASDVVQEAQMEAFRRLDDFLKRQPMPFSLWLRKTAYERLLKIHRYHIETARRSVNREAQLPPQSSLLLAQQLLAHGSSPSKQLSRREIATRVNRALGELPEADREILLMRNIDRLSYEEASCILDIDAAAARKRYGRALLRLRKLLLDAGLLESSA
jgi:RNA polymerase sigma-70 factor (ECF subfamily)